MIVYIALYSLYTHCECMYRHTGNYIDFARIQLQSGRCLELFVKCDQKNNTLL